MPIEIAVPIRQISEREFKEIDYEVMRCAFILHNEMGRLFQEHQYQSEMKALVEKVYSIHRELPIQVSHKSFEKTFRIDFLVANSVIYEFKKTTAIASAHELQLLQYILLAEANRGKVVNFGEKSVTGKLVSSTLSLESRRELEFDFQNWDGSDNESRKFAALIVELLKDLGGFLSIPLYYEAIVKLLGGPEEVIRSIEFTGYSPGGLSVKAHLLNNTTAFKLTSIKNGMNAYETQLQKFLSRTNLTRIQWINLDNHQITFKSVTKN